MKDNRGFSLIEMIVVMAVLAILLTVSLSVFGLNDSGYVKDNSKAVESMLEKACFNTQAKAGKYWMVKVGRSDAESPYLMELYKVKEDDSLEKTEEQTLQKSDLIISSLFVTSTALDEVDLTSMEVYFEKQTGEVKKLVVNGTEYDAADLKGQKGELKIKSNRKEKLIEIYWSTGKVFAES